MWNHKTLFVNIASSIPVSRAMCICGHVCKLMCVCGHVCTAMCDCVPICGNVQRVVCAHMWTRVQTGICGHMYKGVCMCMDMCADRWGGHVCRAMCVDKCTKGCTCVLTHVQSGVWAHVQRDMHPCVCMCLAKCMSAFCGSWLSLILNCSVNLHQQPGGGGRGAFRRQKWLPGTAKAHE